MTIGFITHSNPMRRYFIFYIDSIPYVAKHVEYKTTNGYSYSFFMYVPVKSNRDISLRPIQFGGFRYSYSNDRCSVKTITEAVCRNVRSAKKYIDRAIEENTSMLKYLQLVPDFKSKLIKLQKELYEHNIL
jgi:hypothetical protein